MKDISMIMMTQNNLSGSDIVQMVNLAGATMGHEMFSMFMLPTNRGFAAMVLDELEVPTVYDYKVVRRIL